MTTFKFQIAALFLIGLISSMFAQQDTSSNTGGPAGSAGVSQHATADGVNPGTYNDASAISGTNSTDGGTLGAATGHNGGYATSGNVHTDNGITTGASQGSGTSNTNSHSD